MNELTIKCLEFIGCCVSLGMAIFIPIALLFFICYMFRTFYDEFIN